ncbi:MAG TPA: hypothetical protein VMI33_18440, partial [Streptosporangiaceae bacterium]|nr:hypothetical protein [Streptosporangiaceae bacterium]
MSNPDSPGPYWQEPVGVGRRRARDGSGHPYDREGRHGRPAPGGYGRPAAGSAGLAGYGADDGR